MVATYSRKGRGRGRKTIASRTRSTRRITTLPGLIKGSYSLRMPSSTSTTATITTVNTKPSTSSAVESSSTRPSTRAAVPLSGSPSSVDEVNTILLNDKQTRSSARTKPRSYGKQYLKSGLWASSTPSTIPSPMRPSLRVDLRTRSEGDSRSNDKDARPSKGKGREGKVDRRFKTTDTGREVPSASSTRSGRVSTLFTRTRLRGEGIGASGSGSGRPDPQPGTSSASIPTASETSPRTAPSRSTSDDEDGDDDDDDDDATSSSSSGGAEEIPDSFPPLPMYWGKSLVNQERDFVLPWDLVRDVEDGVLDGKRTPGRYKQIKHNIFVERKPYTEDAKVICNCAPASGCKDGCLNRAMNYLCGKGCPARPTCTNGSLFRRPQKETKVVFTGSRGFGLKVHDSVDEGEFIMDYRGEIIGLETYFNRIRTVYAGRKDFYALDYDMDEVIDAASLVAFRPRSGFQGAHRARILQGQKGNDARFINHSCSPNIEVRKYQTAGAGLEEYEIGFWALRDIAAGEELCYNYNFDSFTTYKRPVDHPESLLTAVAAEGRQRCFCGATNCSGWLGKRSGSTGESSNQASGSNLPEVPVLPIKKKRGRPKGVPNKVKKLKIVEESITEVVGSSRRSRTSGAVDVASPPTTPLPKRRKLEDVIIPSESAIKKLAKARELAMAAARECGISLERSNGRKRSIAQMGETARLARNICNELSSLAAAVASSSMRATAESSRRRVAVPGPPSGISTGSDDNDMESPGPISRPRNRAVPPVSEASGSRRDSVRAGKARAVEELDAEDLEEQEMNDTKEMNEIDALAAEDDDLESSTVWTSASESERERRPSKRSQEGQPSRRSVSVGNDNQRPQPPPAPSPSVINVKPIPPATVDNLVIIQEAPISQIVHAVPPFQINLPVAAPQPEASTSTNVPTARPKTVKKEKKANRAERQSKASRPHAILAPDRMIKSRLALLNGEQLEAERRSRRQGPEWVAAQVTSLKLMHRAIALRAVAPPPGYVYPGRNLDEYYSCASTSAEPTFQTDTTVFSLMLDVPFAAHPVEMWKRSIPVFPFREQDDDEKTLVDPSDYEVYQKDLCNLLGYVKNLKVEQEPTEGPLQDSESAEDQRMDESGEGEAGQDQSHGVDHGDNGQDNAGGGNDATDPPAGSDDAAGNAGGDDGDEGKKGPSDNQEGEPEAEAEEEEEEEEVEGNAKKKRETEAAAGLDHGMAPQDGLAEQASLPLATDGVTAGQRPTNESDQQWFEALHGIVAMQRATNGQEGGVPAEIGPAELAAAQLEMYAQEAVASPRSSQGRDMMTPTYENYENGHYGSPGSAYGPDDYDGHDDDSFQRYIITHGLTVDEIEWSSVSDMTDLEEMEMNEREIVSTAPDMEKYNRSRRSRKPRPPRRFKTIITRIRPKLEAAITDVTPAEEDAALERERRRRKKGQAWLNSMKALAQARREAKARQEAGLPPPEFTLPPTSLTPSGQKKRVKKESDKTEFDDESADPGPSGSASVDNQAAAQIKRKKSTSGKSRVRRPSPPVAPLPAYDYHDGAENQQYLEALGQDSYDTLLVNQAAGSDTGVAALPDDPNVNQDYSALIQQANESAVVDVTGEHHHGVEAYYQQSYDDVESNPVSTLVQAASMFSNGQADAYMQNANFDYSSLQHNPYASINFAQFGQTGEGTSTGGQLPPVPPIGRTLPSSTYSTPSPGRAVSLTTTRTGEKRRRGPPVKKIAGAMLMPLTDEQWEAERKKRKKGYAWVQETKAAAEAERLARAQRAAGLPVAAAPRKPRPSNSGANKMVDQQDVFGHADDLYHTLEGHDHHETLADAHQQQQGLLHDGQDDIVPFPSTADDDFTMGTGLYETQEQDMSHYADHTQNGNHYGDVGMS